ncbi:cation-translocating P-type ATPase [Mordavella massiliensis]|uniref:Cation-translocating P-type ATPase n=2 Tax=Mordavella massiliensis TaxID=1871024 RepID=A0A939BC17_9CLOT|nr:cation-translocating P-type ATPase [Mordavella massiliensis]MBM6827109.1 cation-translocating P-type ATPase [Mordavella massiliensis]
MLTSEQARQNQEKYGFNELVEGKKKSTLQIFLEQYKDFLVIILIIAAIVSGFLGDFESAIVILVVITMNAILGTVQTLKAEQSLDALKQMSAPEAKVIRDGVVKQIPSREVTIGDRVLLEAGDCVPADGKLIECASLKVDESALTGESLSVEKSLDEVPEGAALGDQTNRVFSGSFVTYGRAAYEVTAIGMGTEVGKIASLLKNTSEKRTPLQVNLDDFGKKLSILIIVFCAILFGISIFRGDQPGDAFLFAVALAVAAIPEALSSIVTIVLSFGTQKMAKEHAIIRKLQAVEGLGSVSIVCSDKTGTLTQNKMTVEDYYVDGKRIPVSEINLNDPNQERLLNFSILCNDSSNANGQEIGDPTETALINLGSRLGREAFEVRDVYDRKSEIPFDSDRKLMSTAHVFSGRHVMVVKGAVDVLLTRMTRIRRGEMVEPMTAERKAEIEAQNLEFSRDGLRVLAFAYKEIEENREITLEDENDLTFLGLIAMMDPPREESKAAVAECIQAGIKPIMITGDHKITAAAIAKRIGILKDESEACEGAVIENMSDEELQEFVPKISVYARVSPEHKIRIVRAWQERGNIVAMTGDGVNDAPALKQANIGVAMGITGTEVSKDAAAMVLTDDNFATIVKAVENGRNLYRNIKFSIQFLLSGNFGAILTVLFASIVGLPVPFAPVHLLFINLLTDSLPAIALGLEPHSKDVMNEKPRPMNESILTRDYLARIGTEGLCIGAMTTIAFLIGLNEGGSLLGSTLAFGTLCTSRLVHGFNCKSNKPVIFTKRFFNNIYLIGAFVLGLLLITGVLMIPGLHNLFSVYTLDGAHLLIVYGLALLNLPIIQLMKWIREHLK